MTETSYGKMNFGVYSDFLVLIHIPSANMEEGWLGLVYEPCCSQAAGDQSLSPQASTRQQ